MSRAGDYLSDARWYLAKGRVRVSNAWYRAVGERVQAARTGFRNRRNARTIRRGKRDLPAKAGDQIRSRTPVVRDRINRGTGRPHRDDRMLGRVSDQSLARTKQRLGRSR